MILSCNLCLTYFFDFSIRQIKEPKQIQFFEKKAITETFEKRVLLDLDT